MSTGQAIAWIAAAIIAILIIAAIIISLRRQNRRHALQRQFGPEYDRTVSETGGKSSADKELRQRTERHDRLDIRDLEPDERQHFSRQWEETQSAFVDNPAAALAQADALVQLVMSRRGYPAGGFSQRAADLSVQHADVLSDYRAAHEIADRTARGEASTEEMRRGFVLYRSLFAALLARTDEPAGATRGDDTFSG